MKFLRMIPLIALAVALSIGLMPSGSQAAVVESVLVSQPDNGGFRGIDSTIVVTVKFKSGSTDRDKLAPYVWLATTDSVKGTDEIFDGTNSVVEDSVGYAQYNRGVWLDTLFAGTGGYGDPVDSPTKGDSFLVARTFLGEDWYSPMDPTKEYGDLEAVEVSGPTTVPGGYHWEVTMTLKVTPEMEVDGNVAVWASVFDENEKQPDDPTTEESEFKNGFSTVVMGQDPSGDPCVFTVDGDRPLIVPGEPYSLKFSYITDAATGDTISTEGARLVGGFNPGGEVIYPVMGIGDQVNIGYHLGSAQDSVLFYQWTVNAQLYLTEGGVPVDTVTVGLLHPESITSQATLYFDSEDPNQAGLATDLTPDTTPPYLGLFLADRAGNLSSTDINHSAEEIVGLTRSVDFVVDLNPPDMPGLEEAGTDTVIRPMDTGLLTDGGPNDLNPLQYKLENLEDLYRLQFAFADPSSSEAPQTGVEEEEECVEGPCGGAVPTGPSEPSEYIFAADISLIQPGGNPGYLYYVGGEMGVDEATLGYEPLTPDIIKPINFSDSLFAYADTVGVFDLWVLAEDVAGNVGPYLVRDNVTLDSVEPLFTNVFPLACPLVDTLDQALATVKFGLSEEMGSANVTWTKVSGADIQDTHTYDLSAAELAETARQAFPFADSLVHQTTYGFQIAGRDVAGNYAAVPETADTVRYDTTYQAPRVKSFAVQVLDGEEFGSEDVEVSAGDPVTLQITACDGQRQALGYQDAFTGGTPTVRIEGADDRAEIRDQVTRILSLAGDTWVCGQDTVTVEDFLAPDSMVVTVTDSTMYPAEEELYPAGASPNIFTLPGAYSNIFVSAPDTVAQGQEFQVGVTLSDAYNNPTGVSRYIDIAADQLGIDLPAGKQLVKDGVGAFVAKATSFVDGLLTLRVTDGQESNAGATPVLEPIAGESGPIYVDAPSIAAPDTAVAADYMGADGNGDQGGFITVTWDLSDDHANLSGYRIYRQMMVDYRAGGEGEDSIVMLDEPEEQMVPWAVVDAVPGESIGRAVVATLDNVESVWGVAAEMYGGSSALAKEAFDGAESVSMPYELMANTMVESKKAAEEAVDGPVFATLTPEALAFAEDGIVPQLKSVDNVLSSPITMTAEAVGAIDNIAPEPVPTLLAVDTPSDAGGSITLNWSKSESDRMLSRSVANAVGSVLGDQIPGVMGYAIYRAPYNGEFELVEKVDAGQTSFADNSALNGVRYTYEVRPYDADNETEALVHRTAMAIRNKVFDAAGEPIYGLFGPDKKVDFDDFFIFADHFGMTAQDEAFEPAFDLVPNSVVDFEDFFVFAGNFGRVADVAASKAVPVVAGLNTDARLYLNAGNDLPVSGEEVVVSVDLADYAELKGYGLNVSFDPALLEFVRATSEDNILGEGGLASPQVIADNEGEVAIGAYGETATEGSLDLNLVFRTKDEIENTYIEVTEGEVRDGGYAVNQLALPAPVQIQTRPEVYALGENYPNPFNPATTIKYALPEAAFVKLEIYNVVGQVVRTLVADEQNPGRYAIQWDATNDSGKSLSSGMYFYRLQAGSEFLEIKKMLLLK